MRLLPNSSTIWTTGTVQAMTDETEAERVRLLNDCFNRIQTAAGKLSEEWAHRMMRNLPADAQPRFMQSVQRVLFAFSHDVVALTLTALDEEVSLPPERDNDA